MSNQLIINGTNIYDNLCYYDLRNPECSIPYYIEIGVYDDEDLPPEPRREGCACDNCFYWRDGLAMIIISLHENGD